MNVFVMNDNWTYVVQVEDGPTPPDLRDCDRIFVEHGAVDGYGIIISADESSGSFLLERGMRDLDHTQTLPTNDVRVDRTVEKITVEV